MTIRVRSVYRKSQYFTLCQTHFDVRHHFFRDHVEKKNIRLEYIFTEEQMTNIFTKPLDQEAHSRIRRSMGIYELNEILC